MNALIAALRAAAKEKRDEVAWEYDTIKTSVAYGVAEGLESVASHLELAPQGHGPKCPDGRACPMECG